MSDINRRADVARRLMGDADLASVLDEIREAASAVFLNAASTQEAIMAAHHDVRAVETLRNALQRRLDDKMIADKREQHRGHD